MNVKELSYTEKKAIEDKLNSKNNEIFVIEVFSEEPFIQLKNGLVIYLTEVRE